MRKTGIIFKIAIAAMSLIFVLSGCSRNIELVMPDGTVVSVETMGLSREQIDLLKEVEQGEENVVELLRSGLFTLEKLSSLGLDLPGKFPNINFGDGISDGYPDKDAPGAGN